MEEQRKAKIVLIPRSYRAHAALTLRSHRAHTALTHAQIALKSRSERGMSAIALKLHLSFKFERGMSAMRSYRAHT